MDPGRRTRARTGVAAVGAVHGRGPERVVGVAESWATGTVCRPAVPDVERADRFVAMCGRYATTRNATDLAAIFDAADETDEALAADYNVAPTDPVPIVRSEPERRLSVARWGLVPSWADGPAAGGRRQPLRINARAETVATNGAFARAFRRHRCLVPADGWYEWRRTEDGRGKQAYFMTPRDGGVLAFAGLCATSSAGRLTCAVVTTAAVGDLALVHDRMPLLLPPDRWGQWLSAPVASGRGDDTARPDEHSAMEPESLLAVPPAAFLDALEIRPVGPAVGDVRNDGPDLIDRVVVTPLRVFDVEPTDLTLF
ncbi:SOS response-associated peptidase [Rugosimonospora acidiphila]|uniref:Abasic site processing protein n=2 Tax=Rugosimonospora acidiphila TaxID=556531 RepID=A0ABP9RQ85_9ACTN